MASELQFVFQYCAFILSFVRGWLSDSPQVLVILLLVTVTSIGTWRILTQMTGHLPSKTSLLLLLLLTACLLRDYNHNKELLGLQESLASANWRIRQGAQHRVELLETIETNNLVRRHAGGLEQVEEEKEGNPLDGCLHVFIDLGSNRGLQIRKLYEPDTFPLAPVQPLYQRFFGNPEDRNLREICSVSFEPSTKHAEHLKKLADAYATCGIRVVIYKAGVGHKNMKTKFGHFNTFYGHEIGHDVSARLIDDNESRMNYDEEVYEDIETEEVEVIRFATFITDIVAKRKLPTSAKVTTPRVVIKSDIEGAELKIIPDMVMTGALGHVDNIHMEWHGECFYRKGREPQMVSKLALAITALAELTKSEDIEQKFEIEEMDDETYSGIGQFKPWGDYSEMPLLTC
eukprot:GFUD01018986.1.p1 GENE.GFUD01018986.1~~GFUD01018986.1.p1  ORF type:complete len:402 (-),score=98.09 GFUD01018986.1:115-1320(-)